MSGQAGSWLLEQWPWREEPKCHKGTNEPWGYVRWSMATPFFQSSSTSTQPQKHAVSGESPFSTGSSRFPSERMGVVHVTCLKAPGYIPQFTDHLSFSPETNGESWVLCLSTTNLHPQILNSGSLGVIYGEVVTWHSWAPCSPCYRWGDSLKETAPSTGLPTTRSRDGKEMEGASGRQTCEHWHTGRPWPREGANASVSESHT